jgi:hypothetical protein
MGPFKAMGANVRTIKTRTMAYVPFEVLETLLGGQTSIPAKYSSSTFQRWWTQDWKTIAPGSSIF